MVAIENLPARAQDYCVRHPLVLDPIDRHLLDLIQSDAARPLHELGADVGLSPSAVQRRLSRYRAAGVLVGQVAVVDPRQAGNAVLAAVLVTLDRESAEHHADFRERMLGEPRVQQCYDLAGEWDYLVMLVTGDLRECRELSDRLFLRDENVRRFDTLPVLEPIKTGRAVPLRE